MYDSESQVFIIYHPVGEEKKIKQSIATAISSEISPEQVVLRERAHGLTAYVELPSAIASNYLEKKSLMVNGEKLSIRPFFCDHQIFINKLPNNIDEKDVKEYFEQFGKIVRIQIQKVNHGYEARHCYIKFAKDEDAQNVLYHEKRHVLKNDEELRVHRTFTIKHDEQTDKKFFLKLQPKVEKPEEMQKQLHNLFRKYGELRERIRLQDSNSNSSKSVITFVSQKEGEEAFQNEKQTMIGKYKLILRPYASDLAIFAPNIKPQITEEDLKKVFSEFGRVIECRISTSSYNRNATINYADEENARRVLAEYPESKEIMSLFKGKAKLNVHMTLKERNEIKDQNREKKRNWQNLSNPNMGQQQMMMNMNMLPNMWNFPQGQGMQGNMGQGPQMAMSQPPMGQQMAQMPMNQVPMMGMPMNQGNQNPMVGNSGMTQNRQPPRAT